MEDDGELLRRYVRDRSEGAFGALVNRHLGLVYHTARRSLGGDAHRAEDIAQSVFADLARKAPRLIGHPSLVAWLHRSTRLASRYALRTDARRHQREIDAHFMNEINASENEPLDWEQLSPIIDEALETLPATDREAVLLRYFEALDYPEMGRRLRLSADGARSRVDRALDRMHGLLVRRGITSSVAALSVTLTSHAAIPAPAALSAAVAGGAMQASAAGSSVFTSFLMATPTLKTATGVTLLALVGTFAWYEHDWVRELQSLDVNSPPVPLNALPANPSPAIAPAGSATASVGSNSAAGAASGSTSPLTAFAATSAAGFPTDVVSVATSSYRGNATPVDALISEAWASYTGAIDTLADSVTFSAEGQKILQEMYETLPAHLRAQFRSPEQMYATRLAAQDAAEARHVLTQQFLDQVELAPGEMAVQLVREFDSAPEVVRGSYILRSGKDGTWRRLIEDSALRFLASSPDRLAQRLEAYLAERPPAPGSRPASVLSQ